MSKHRGAYMAIVAAAALTLGLIGSAMANAAPRRPEPDGLTSAQAPTVWTRYANRTEETFDDVGWWRGWGMTSAPQRTAVLAEPDGNRLLQVKFGAGTHDGTTFFYPTGTADEVHVRYRMQLSPGFDPSASASNVKMPGFGSPRRSKTGACLAGCGGMPADGITSYSARSDIHATGAPGWYVYWADMPKTVPSYGTGGRWRTPAFTPGRWYTVNLYLKMNTPGSADGTMRAVIDGVQVAAYSGLELRRVDTLHVGAAWFDFYYGGAGVAPRDMWVRLDDIVVEW